jgi:DNA anti-recombination protein RmuC
MSSPKEENRKEKGANAQPAAPPSGQEGAGVFDGDLAGGNLDKVRNILFGAQSRDFERRFGRLEEALAKETSEIRAEMRGRFDALEGHVKRELESLADRLKAEEAERNVAMREVTGQVRDTAKAFNEKLKAEQSERSDALNELSSELRTTANGIDRRVAQLDEQMSRANRELRDQLQEQGRRHSDELRGKSEELWAALAKAIQELRRDKTDRAALAALLTEVAMRLNDEFKLPTGE